MDFSFRDAGLSDLEFIWQGRKEIADLEKFTIPDESFDRKRIHKAIVQGSVRVACRKNRPGLPAGFLWVSVSSKTPFGIDYGPFGITYAYIEFAFVKKEYRDKGVGKALYQDLFTYCRQEGISEVICDIYEVNAQSISFHEHMGFRPFTRLYSKKV